MRTEDAKKFVKENARPLEKALYSYYYEDADAMAVVATLSVYQNEDGGFGKGLEPDNWNPNSNPIATNDAIITLHRIGALQKGLSMVEAIACYLDSHDSFDEEKQKWLFCIDTNRDYPHAIWWEKEEGSDGISRFNPTVSLAAFMVCYSFNPEPYKGIVIDAFNYLKTVSDEELGTDDLKCYLVSYEMLKQNNTEELIDTNEAFDLIQKKLIKSICRDTSKYGVEYVAFPSDFFDGRYREFLNNELLELCRAELEALDKLQKDDGGFDISWQWYTEYPEFSTARNQWRPRLTLDKLLFVREMDKSIGIR